MRRPFALLLVPLLASCASAADPSVAPDGAGHVLVSGDAITVSTAGVQRTVSAEVAAPVDEVWAALPAVLEEMGFTGAADEAQRTFFSQPRTVRRRLLGQPLTRYVDCGRGEFGVEIAAARPIRLTVRSTVQPGENGASRVDTVVQAEARSSSGGANAVMANCRSVGTLEAEIAVRLGSRLDG